jgi:hypothetical protein
MQRRDFLKSTVAVAVGDGFHMLPATKGVKGKESAINRQKR